jgi:hypothetical protein
LIASFGGVWAFCTFMGIDEFFAKLLVDIILAMLSYQIQMRWVFSKAKHEEEEPSLKRDKIVNVFHPFGKCFKFIARIFFFKWKIECKEQAEDPAVYIVPHQNLFGPIHTMALLSKETRLWTLHVFLNQRECFRQLYDYTFSERYGWPNGWAGFLAGLLSLIVPGFLRSFGCVPVYRNTRNIHMTINRTLEALFAKESILICPDIEYTDSGSGMGEMYTGYLHLEKPYYDRTGKHLPFVPVYCSKKQKKLLIGKAVYFNNQKHFHEERAEITLRLKRGINAMGYVCGDIDATKFAEIQKADT